MAKELKSVLPSEVDGLAAPAADGLRTLAIQIAPQVLATAPVQTAWREANRTAQIELLRILKGGSKTISTNNGEVTLQLHTLLVQLAAQLGLRQQFESVQSKLQGSTGEVARGAVQEKLRVKLPPTSGGVVLLRSSQLKTAQDIVKAIKGLAVVLPLIALLLFILAVWLADGWRRVALRTSGWCLVAIGLLAVLARRVLSNYVVNSLVKVPANKPAVQHAFAIGTSLLYDLAIAMITYGLVVVLAAWLAGHTRAARSVRRALAPVAARARAIRLRGRGHGPAARGRLGTVPLDARAAPGHRLRDSARARYPCPARDDGTGVPRRAARRFRARDSCLVRRAATCRLLGDLGGAFDRGSRRRRGTRGSATSNAWRACTTEASSPTRSFACRRRRSYSTTPDDTFDQSIVPCPGSRIRTSTPGASDATCSANSRGGSPSRSRRRRAIPIGSSVPQWIGIARRGRSKRGRARGVERIHVTGAERRPPARDR